MRMTPRPYFDWLQRGGGTLWKASDAGVRQQNTAPVRISAFAARLVSTNNTDASTSLRFRSSHPVSRLPSVAALVDKYEARIQQNLASVTSLGRSTRAH